jgi:hypothetical protein
MAVRCSLLGHNWGEWEFKREHTEYTDIVTRDSYGEARKITAKNQYQRKCNRCGNTESKLEIEQKGSLEPVYNIDRELLPPKTIEPTNERDQEEIREFFLDLEGYIQNEKEADRRAGMEAYEDVQAAGNHATNRFPGPFTRMQLDNEEYDDYWFKLGDRTAETSPDLREDYELFNGDICLLDSPEDLGGLPVEVRLKKVRDTSLNLGLRAATSPNRVKLHHVIDQNDIDFYLYKLYNPVPYNRQLEALNAVKSSKNKKEILSGSRSIRFTRKLPAPKPGIELNEYQNKALAWADCAEDFLLIHGPPGTGKTRTLTAYIRHLTRKDVSVLVAAHSNQAVDNLLAGDSTVESPEEGTLHAMCQATDSDFSIARVGDRSENPVVNEYYREKDVSEADVVASTTSGAAEFSTNQFEVAVVDEATQADRPSTAIVLNAAEKVILAGDHKQLPPYSADENMQEEEMHISLFEDLLHRYGSEITVLLKKQYRMNEQIATFPNRSFYDGELETAEMNRNWTLDDLKPVVGVDLQGEETQQTGGHSYFNTTEAEEAADQVELLCRSGVDPSDIGVIAAYSGQVSEINKRVRHLDFSGSENVTVDTVDSFQGGEREAIIVSFVRSNNSGNSGFLDFPDVGARRLNVAMTRARKRLVLIADWKTLSTVPSYKTKGESCAPLYSELEDFLRENKVMKQGRST